MKLATIKGHATSTVKHPSFKGMRMLIAQPISRDGSHDGAPQIVFDCLGAAIGQDVLISSDGSEARLMVGDESSPARWSTLGIVDPEKSLAL